MKIDQMYQELILSVLGGPSVGTRNSVCRRKHSLMLTFDSCPLISVRKTSWKTALREMEWFLSGSNQLKDAHKSVWPWWEPWASPGGIIPNNYSVAFRQQWPLFMGAVKAHPYSRRNVMTTWNESQWSDETPITNCHGTAVQAFVRPSIIEGERDTLDLTMYQRSCDLICGVPHNWIQYWGLLVFLAGHCGYTVGQLTWIGGDVHVYEAHLELAKQICSTYVKHIEPHELCYSDPLSRFAADGFALDRKYVPILTDKAEMIV